MRGDLRAWWVTGMLVLSIGCSSDDEPGDGGGSAGMAGAAGEGGAAGGGSGGEAGKLPVVCTSARPANGSSCTDEGLMCTYGDEALPSCRVSAVCSGGSWDAPDPPCAPPGAGCPPTPPLDGVPCADLSALCWYDEGTICACNDCPPGPPCTDPMNQWYCGAELPSDCPPLVPNAGTECDIPGNVTCEYGSCSTEGPYIVTCDRGLWQWEIGVCPQ